MIISEPRVVQLLPQFVPDLWKLLREVSSLSGIGLQVKQTGCKDGRCPLAILARAIFGVDKPTVHAAWMLNSAIWILPSSCAAAIALPCKARVSCDELVPARYDRLLRENQVRMNIIPAMRPRLCQGLPNIFAINAGERALAINVCCQLPNAAAPLCRIWYQVWRGWRICIIDSQGLSRGIV